MQVKVAVDHKTTSKENYMLAWRQTDQAKSYMCPACLVRISFLASGTGDRRVQLIRQGRLKVHSASYDDKKSSAIGLTAGTLKSCLG